MSDATTQHTPADVREQAAADADEIWYHWIEGQEDLAIAALRMASDEELARFLDTLARWQKCPKPSDHDAALLRTPRGEGERGLIMRAMLETFPWSPDIQWAHFERAADAVIAALRSEAQGEVWREVDDLLARLERFEYDAAGESEEYWRVVTIRDRIAAARRGEGGGE